MESSSQRRIDGHRLSEFIYGTVMGMVAIAGMSTEHQMSWLEAAAIIVVGAAAIWVAHAYSQVLSRRIAGGQHLQAHDLAETLRGSWPIVTAGLLLILPLLPAAVGLWSVDTGLGLSSALGVVILGVIGVTAGTVTHETWPRRILLAAFTAGLGLVIVAVEFAVHH
ncbi:MAG: hypothetical protein R2844_11825 [Caldilineales bacterium]